MSLSKWRLKSKNSADTKLYRGVGQPLWKGYDPHPGHASHYVRFIGPLGEVKVVSIHSLLVVVSHVGGYAVFPTLAEGGNRTTAPTAADLDVL